jgi:hypothetical protein
MTSRTARSTSPSPDVGVPTYLPTQNCVDLLMDSGLEHIMIEASQNHTETH